MADVSNLEAVHSALKALDLLRSTVGDIFKYLVNSPQINPVLPETELQQAKDQHTEGILAIMGTMTTRLRELETACTLLTPLASNISLGNTQLLSQDPLYDQKTLYSDMIISYRWLDNMHEYGMVALQALHTNFSKRNSNTRAKRRQLMSMNIHNVGLNSIDFVIANIQRSLDIPIEVVRPLGIFTILKVVINRTLRAVLVMRGFMLEWVLVKAYEESFENICPNSGNRYNNKRPPHPYMTNLTDSNNCKLDIWTPSRYQIFQTITEHANAAVLHFYTPFQMESSIKAFLHWFKLYSNLFTAKCRKCDTRLLNNMPPTWRDFRTQEPFHFECRP